MSEVLSAMKKGELGEVCMWGDASLCGVVKKDST